MWTQFVKGLGSFLEWSFGIFTFFGNGFNYFMMAVASVFLVWWIMQMMKHTKEEKNHQY